MCHLWVLYLPGMKDETCTDTRQLNGKAKVALISKVLIHEKTKQLCTEACKCLYIATKLF